MPRIFLFIAVSIVQALSTPVFNNLALYETLSYVFLQQRPQQQPQPGTQIEQQSGSLSSTNVPFNITFKQAFLHFPKVIYFINRIEGLKSCQIGIIIELTHMKVTSIFNDTPFTCQIDLLAIDSSVSGISELSGLTFTYNMSYTMQAYQTINTLQNFSIDHTTAHVLCQGYRIKRSNTFYSYSFSTSVTYNTNFINLTLNWTGIDSITLSIVFFDLSIYHFYQTYEFTFMETANIPKIQKTEQTIGIVGLSSIINATNLNLQVFNCRLNIKMLPQCSAPISINPNKIIFLVLYIRDQNCSYPPDPNLNKNTCQCKVGYSRNNSNQMCTFSVSNRPTLPLFLSHLNQRFNQISLNLSYSQKVGFIIPLQQSISLFLDGNLVSNVIFNFNGTTIALTFNITKEVTSIKIVVSDSSAKNLATQVVLPQHNVQVSKYLYYYSPTEQNILALTKAFLANGTKATMGMRSLGIVFGGVCYLLDLIEFTQQVIFYLFLDFQLPNNLKSVLQILYSSNPLSLFEPISVKLNPPFPDQDDSFSRPSLYETYDFSFNFISDNIYALLQILAMVIFYHIASFLATFIPANYFIIGHIGNYMRRNYASKIYSNSIQCFLSCQVTMTFAAAVVFLDRKLVSYFKIYSFAAVVVFVFLSGMLCVLIHVLTITSLKKSKKIDIQDCYPRLEKEKQSTNNQKNIFMRYLNCFLLALTIPLVPSSIAISVVFFTLIFEVITTYRSKFQNQFYCVHRMAQVSLQALLHVCLLLIWAFQYFKPDWATPFHIVILGYIAIGIILFHITSNFLIIVIEILISIVKLIIDYIKQKDQNKKQIPKQKMQNRNQLQNTKIEDLSGSPSIVINQDTVIFQFPSRASNLKVNNKISESQQQTLIQVKSPKTSLKLQSRNRLMVRISKFENLP